jgi:hypothetical protein
MSDVDQISRLSKDPLGRSITIEYPNGCRQRITPTKAFDGNWRALCEAVAGMEDYRIVKAGE